MRFSRENRAKVPRTREEKIVAEKRKETRKVSRSWSWSLERGREFRDVSLLPPASCGSAICQAGEYTTRDNGEVSQTLRTLSRLTNARPSPVRFRGTARFVCVQMAIARHMGVHARMISAPSGNGMIQMSRFPSMVSEELDEWVWRIHNICIFIAKAISF